MQKQSVESTAQTLSNAGDALFHGDLVNTRRILYTPSEFAKSCLIYLQEIGELQATKQHTSARNNLDSFLFLIVESGSGKLTLGQNVYELTTGDCAIIDCHTAYSHETSADLWKLKWIHFNGPTVSQIYQKYRERGGQPCFHADSTEQYQFLWNTLYEIASSKDYIRDMRINEQLTALLTKFMEISWNPDRQAVYGKKQSILEIRDYLEQHLEQKITLDDLADRFFINKYYLTRVFKEQFGVSINTYLLSLRITKAKQLLRFSDLSIETIGMECGLGALYYFSRMFKKVEGISPSEYRKKW